MGAICRLKVDEITRRADEVVEIALSDIAGNPLPEWKAGAHLSFNLSPDLERQYSLCGSLKDRNQWRVAVLRAPEGRGGSEHIHTHVKVGDVLDVAGPRNHFSLQPASSYIFVAGGIGITPILPMIEQATAQSTPWKLYYGGRTLSSMAYRDVLASYGDKVNILSQDVHGMLDLRKIAASVTPDTHVYSCGPSGLLDALVDLSSNWPKDTLHLERFSPIAAKPDQANKPFIAHLRASGKSVLVGAGESLLEALAREGIQRPSACREGTCGSCETRVLSGGVDHRDSVLSPSEQEQGDWMMICVSRAFGKEIELDA